MGRVWECRNVAWENCLFLKAVSMKAGIGTICSKCSVC